MVALMERASLASALERAIFLAVSRLMLWPVADSRKWFLSLLYSSPAQYSRISISPACLGVMLLLLQPVMAAVATIKAKGRVMRMFMEGGFVSKSNGFLGQFQKPCQSRIKAGTKSEVISSEALVYAASVARSKSS